jgi:hypothetical protein
MVFRGELWGEGGKVWKVGGARVYAARSAVPSPHPPDTGLLLQLPTPLERAIILSQSMKTSAIGIEKLEWV